MARRNKSYAERQAENIREGISPEIAHRNEVEEKAVHELDTPEKQAEILRPEMVEVPFDGGSIELPTQLTLGSLMEKRTMAVIDAMRTVIVDSVRELGGDFNNDAEWFNRNLKYIPMVVYKLPVMNVVADFIELLSGKPASDFKEKINAATVSSAFVLALRIITGVAENKTGASDSKKA
jgi:hypothetical protein